MNDRLFMVGGGRVATARVSGLTNDLDSYKGESALFILVGGRVATARVSGLTNGLDLFIGESALLMLNLLT